MYIIIYTHAYTYILCTFIYMYVHSCTYITHCLNGLDFDGTKGGGGDVGVAN